MEKNIVNAGAPIEEQIHQEIKKQKRNLKDLLQSLSGIPVSNFNDKETNFVYISDKLKEFYPKT